MIQSNLINKHDQEPPILFMDELLLSSTHLMSSSTNHPPPPPPPPPPAKKKRSLPGHPDPGAEVISLSPNSLLATNRFMCEICNKGFQRDQNLQLHRRGHNLPWKLKQRPKDEVVRKKVYVCPEPGCVHNDPARALGDLTGIKKHFYRKHGEKKWKCDKCSKKYAVQSDWKAHSKTCGTKEYKCDCGTLFSRRDSFITHRAFCDALVEDTARALTSNPFLPAPQHQEATMTTHDDHHQSPVATSSSTPHNNNMLFLQDPDPPQLMIPQQEPHPEIPNLIPPWLQNPSHSHSHVIGGPNYPPPPPPQPHLSATALLQKAAQLGAIISSKTASTTTTTSLPAGGCRLTAQPPPPVTAGFGLNLSSHDQQQQEIMGNPTSLGFFTQGFGGSCSSSSSSSSLLRDLLMMNNDNVFANARISDGLTRDFLGLRPLIDHGDHGIVNLNMAGLGDTTNAASSSSQEHRDEW